MEFRIDADFEPAYLRLHREGQLAQRVHMALGMFEACRMCPRECGVNRFQGEIGVCSAPPRPKISSVGPHYGEEPPLVGFGGSGTIFFSHCNLKCVFCQNSDISQLGHGYEISTQELAGKMLQLQSIGCHNINFVTPTPYVPHTLEALELAVGQGLKLPLVYNCGGYESMEMIRLLDGIVDIYMPDFKYGDDENAKKYSKAEHYFSRCSEALEEMHRQVGVLKMDDRGIAQRGVLIRHLVMPHGLAGSRKVLEFIAKCLSKDSYVNIMAQYYPSHRADEFSPLTRRITPYEYDEAVTLARDCGLHRGL
ncbi:MAG: radical SAM protein [Gemmatimonadota bacterium]|nr:MAG: radical SAM protein [Gemmatimonadota bacterium]